MVTIGLPFYNAVHTLGAAIQSVFAQTLQEWTLLLVDDGSTDGSVELVQNISDSRVRLFSDGRRLGLAKRLNQVVALTREPYVARLDADDMMHPQRLERQTRYLETHQQFDLVDSQAIVLDRFGAPRSLRGSSALDTRPASVLRRGLLIHAAVVGRTTWFHTNPYCESLRRAQDFELWCRTCKYIRAARVMEPLYFIRENGNRKTKRDTYVAVREVMRLHGPELVGKARTRLAESTVMAKYLFTYLDRVVSVRCARQDVLSPRERMQALAMLGTVYETVVPGLTNVVSLLVGGSK